MPSPPPASASSPRPTPPFHRISVMAGGVVILIGSLDLLGYLFGIEALVRIVPIPGAGIMMPNTALGFILSGAALLLVPASEADPLRRTISRLLAAAAAMLGLLTLTEYIFKLDLGIDLLLFGETVRSLATRFPGRPAPNTAFCFLLTGLSLLLLDLETRQGRRPAQVLPLIVAPLAIQALIGYAYGQEELWTPEAFITAISSFTPMAIHTALGFLLVSLGIFFARPDRGLAAAFTRDDVGGVLLRRLLPAAMLVPFLVGWLRLEGERAGLYGTTFGLSLFVMTTITALVVLIGWSAGALRRMDAGRRAAEEALRRSEEGLALAQEIVHIGNMDLDLRTSERRWSDETYRILGYTPGEVVPTLEAFMSRLHPQDRALVDEQRQSALETGQPESREYRLLLPDDTVRYVSSAAKVYFDEEKRPIRFVGTLQDITERKRMEEALREARVRLELALSAASIGTWVYDVRAGIIHSDERMAQLFSVAPARAAAGAPLEEFLEAIHPEDRTRVERLVVQAMESGTGYAAEYRLVQPDGTVRWVEARGRCELDDAGRPVSFPGVVVDITARRRAEEALRESEERFRSAYEHAPIGMALVSLEGRFLQVNQSLCDIVGYSKEELRAKTFQDITHPEDLETDLTEMKKLLAGELSSYQLEKRYLRKDGEVVWTQLTASLVRDVSGAPLYGVGQVQDITARRRAERAQRLLAEAGVLLASSLDPGTTLASVTRLAVPALADWCEIDVLDHEQRVEVVEVAAADPERDRLLQELRAAGPLGPARPDHTIARLLQSGEPVVVREVSDEMLEAWARTGRHKALLHRLAPRSLMAVPLVARGRTLGTMVLASSESGRLYEAPDLALAGELAGRAALAVDNAYLYQTSEHATRMRDEVLRIVAHDLRAPLTGISLTAQMLQKRVPAPEQAKLEMIVRGVGRANRLIHDLLDVARMEAGQLPVEQRPEEVAQIVGESIEGQRAQAEAKSLHLEAELEDGISGILADRGRVLQILSNLLGNAIKFTPEGGRVTLRAEGSGDIVRFCVRDTGPGIPAGDLPHLFDPFWQARKGHEGAGLGLAIVKGLVEAHGGRIWVESTPGAGSAFCFTLPVARAIREPVPAA